MGILAGAAVALVSCFETEQEFTLNPDGSGKVVHESKFQPFDFNIAIGGRELSEEEKMKQAVASIIEKSKGIDAWDDVHFERLEDGRIHFRGTAWFPDISKLEIENQMMLEFDWNRDPSGNGALSMSVPVDGEDGGKEAEGPPEGEEERRAWLATERGQYQQARMMMASFLPSMSHTATFTLPGDAAETHGFEDAGDGRVSIRFQGAGFLETLDEFVADDEWMLEHGFSGGGGDEIPPELLAAVFGGEEIPTAARTALGEPAFDYQAEVAAARENAEALAERIGGSAASRLLPPSEGGPLKDARVVGVATRLAIDPEIELRMFNHHEGVTVTVLCEFDGAVLSVDNQKSAVETAVTEDGTSLLPRPDFQRHLHSMNLSEGKTHASFQVQLDPPPAGAERLRDLAGTIHYSVAAETEEIDLGIASIAEEERGDELGAEITEIKPGWREDGPLQMSLRLNIPREQLVNAWLVRGDSRTALENRGYGSSGNVTTFNFELEQDFDPDAGIVVEIYDGIRNYTTPFILRDIALPVIGGE